MKKYILSAAIVLGSFATQAANTVEVNPVSKAVVLQEEYTEVKLEVVPTAVKEALKKAYPEAVLDKAFVNANKEYKLEITVGDKRGNLFADANGKWIQK